MEEKMNFELFVDKFGTLRIKLNFPYDPSKVQIIRDLDWSAFQQNGFVLVSTLIKEGVDLPVMNAVVLAGGGKSGIRVIQTIGRALRPKNGINEALIIDVRDDGKYVGEHFRQRQETMKQYYGRLYDEGQVSLKELGLEGEE